MLLRMHTGVQVDPSSGPLAGMGLFTANTASRFFAVFDDAPAFHWVSVLNARSTSNTPVTRVVEMPQTDVGPAVADPGMRVDAPRGFRARDAIFELRRVTGLTWDELAKLLSVTRRSLHLWANGHPINAPNEMRLRDMVSAMRTIDRGTARENRALLMCLRPEGGVLSDLLRDGHFDKAQAQAGPGNRRATSTWEAGDAPSRAVRLSVEDTFSTRSDRIHINDSAALLGRRRRRPREG